MVPGSFRVGQRVQLDEVEHRIHRVLDNDVVMVEDLTTGRMKEYTLAHLLQAWSTGDLRIGDRASRSEESALVQAIKGAHEDAFRQSYSSEQQDRARAKLVYVERLDKLPRTGSVMSPVIGAIWRDEKLWSSSFSFKRPPHFTTVATWIRTFSTAGRDIRSLVDRHHEKGNDGERLNPIVETMMGDLIQTRYLTQERPTLQTVLKELKGLIALRNTTRLASERLQVPSYNTLKRRLANIEPYERHRVRYGQLAADLKFRAAGSGVIVTRPLERASMDHTRLDVFVVDQVSGLPLGRPWLTVIIDEFSRYILGYYVSFEEPSSVSMTRALRHAIAPKKASPDTRVQWDAWGLIEVLVVDNGLEFHGRALEAGAGRYGISIQFCPRRKPWFKGKIERLFGTLNSGLLVDMKGKTFSNIMLKGDYDPAKHAVITLETFQRILNTWVVDVYHQEIHRTLGTSPEQAWKEGLQSADRYLPPSSIAVEAAFSSSTTRRLTHKGIEFDLLFYNSAELRVVRQKYGSEIEVEVRTQDDDLGFIVVVCPDHITLLKVPAINLDYANGLTRWQHRVCKRYQRRAQEDEARHISLYAARERIRELIEQDMSLRRRKTRKQQQRFLQSDKSVTPTKDDVSFTLAERDAASVLATSYPLPSAPTNLPSPALAPQLLFHDQPKEMQVNDDIPTFPSRKRRGVGME